MCQAIEEQWESWQNELNENEPKPKAPEPEPSSDGDQLRMC